MRPRVFPAEDRIAEYALVQDPHVASMRPRVFPAEDNPAFDEDVREYMGFNEAAGIPRGRLLGIAIPGRSTRTLQ